MEKHFNENAFGPSVACKASGTSPVAEVGGADLGQRR